MVQYMKVCVPKVISKAQESFTILFPCEKLGRRFASRKILFDYLWEHLLPPSCYYMSLQAGSASYIRNLSKQQWSRYGIQGASSLPMFRTECNPLIYSYSYTTSFFVPACRDRSNSGHGHQINCGDLKRSDHYRCGSAAGN